MNHSDYDDKSAAAKCLRAYGGSVICVPLFHFMPTYEYHCEKCGKNFDCSQSMKASPLKVCSKELCRQKKWGKGTVKRLFGTGAGLIFKGSGFYITDYRSAGYKEAAKKESGADAPAKTADKPKIADKPKASDKPKAKD